MTDPAPRTPDHPVDPAFPARWSPRAFTDAGMPPADLLTVLEAARWSPSASNTQPWRFVYGLRGSTGFAAIAEGLTGGNRDWAPRAAALVVTVAQIEGKDAEGNPRPQRWAEHDTGAAGLAMALQAERLGYRAHPMGGFDPAALHRALAIPEAGHRIMAVIAIGRQGPADLLPEQHRPRETPGPRRPLAELAFEGRFGR